MRILQAGAAGAFTVREPSVTLTDRLAAAAVFSPVAPSMFVAWAAVGSSQLAFIERYSIDTGESEGLIQKDALLAKEREGDFELVRMKISNDGTLLFVTVETGIHVYLIEP